MNGLMKVVNVNEKILVDFLVLNEEREDVVDSQKKGEDLLKLLVIVLVVEEEEKDKLKDLNLLKMFKFLLKLIPNHLPILDVFPNY